MKTTVVADGICSTCRHRDGCSPASSTGSRPLVVCREFEVTPTVPRQRPVPGRGVRSGGGGGGRADGPAATGLCGTCELRETCALPRRTGGVWHCEEYR